jgi:hypothetical protein
MRKQKSAMLALLGFLAALPCAADHIVYTINGGSQFGLVDLATGAFAPVGAPLPYPVSGIGYGPDGKLYSLDATNSLIRINTSTGAVSTVGPSGIPLLPFQPGWVAVGFVATGSGGLYGISWDNILYRFDPATGAGTMVGATGLPVVDVNAFLSGTANFLKGMAGLRNEVYLSYHAFNLDQNGIPSSNISPAALYRVDLITGAATKVGDLDPFTWLLGAVNGVLYGEQVRPGPDGPSLAIVRINPNTGASHVVVAGLTMDHFFDATALLERRPWPSQRP